MIAGVSEDGAVPAAAPLPSVVPVSEKTLPVSVEAPPPVPSEALPSVSGEAPPAPSEAPPVPASVSVFVPALSDAGSVGVTWPPAPEFSEDC